MVKKIILYISTFLPLLGIMWIKECVLFVLDIHSQKAMWKDLYFNPFLITELLLMISIAIMLSILLKRSKKTATKRIKITAVKNRTAEYYLAYNALFVLSLIGFSLTDITDIVVLSLLFFILGFVYVKNDLYFINPTINIFRSYIYEIEYADGKEMVGKLVIAKEKLKIKEIIEIEVSEFEFTFARRKHEQRH